MLSQPPTRVVEGVSQPHVRRYRASERPSSRSLVRISSMVSGAVRAEVCLQTTPLCPLTGLGSACGVPDSVGRFELPRQVGSVAERLGS